MSFLLRASRFTASSLPSHSLRLSTQRFSTSRHLAIKVDSSFISRITAAEKTLTNSDEPVKNGPTAKAQTHVGQELNAQVVSDITAGEKVITGSDEPVKGGPTSVAQGYLTGSGSNASTSNTSNTSATRTRNQAGSSNSAAQHTGTLDSATLSKITDAEKNITGRDGPIPGGPTAKAQQHGNDPITSKVLSDITEGEKKVTGGERVKGGPTSRAQSELGKSRND